MTPGLHSMLELARIAGWDWDANPPTGTQNTTMCYVIHTEDFRLFRVPDSHAGLFKLTRILQGLAV